VERADRRHSGLVRDLGAARALRNEIVYGLRPAAGAGSALTRILLSQLSSRQRRVLERELFHGLGTAGIG
jgi:hypothetical protein